MTNKYPGRCAACAGRVLAGTGVVVRVGGAWRVYCQAHRPSASAQTRAVIRPTIVVRADHDDGEGETIFVASRGRLEQGAFERYRDACRRNGCRWDGPNGGWFLSELDRAPQLLAELREVGVDVSVDDRARALLKVVTEQIKAQRQKAEAEAQADVAAAGGRVYPYQVEGIAWLRAQTGALLADDPGLGKTLQAAIAAGNEAPLLVLCPAIAKSVWRREICRWTARGEDRIAVLSGRGSFRWPRPGEAVIVNYDVLDKDAVQASQPARGTVLVLDEAHYVRSATARRTKACRAAADSVRDVGGRVWALTGTPLVNRPTDLWNLSRIVGCVRAWGGWPGFVKAWNGRRGRYGGYEWGQPGPDAAKALAAFMLRRRKAEVLDDLPEIREEIIEVNDLPADLRAELDLCGDALLEELERILRGEGGRPSTIGELSSVRRKLACAKALAAEQIVDDLEAAGEPVVIFSAHREPVERFGGRKGWAAITGDTSAVDRARIVEDFQGGKLRGIACVVAAAGTAITLTRASRAIFIDRSWSPADNIQARDRIYRLGQSRGTLITYLVAAHDVDRRVEAVLAEKAARIAGSVEAAASLRRSVPRDLDKWLASCQATPPPIPEQGPEEIDLSVAAGEELRRRGFLQEVAGAAEAAGDGRPHRARTEREKWAHDALRRLTLADPDRARERNESGWSQADGRIGRVLLAAAETAGLSDAQWEAAIKLLRKYRRQVGLPPA